MSRKTSITISLILCTLSMMVQAARRPFAAYFILYLACITPGYYLFTEGGKYTRLPNLAFSVIYLLFLAAVSSLFRSNCYMYLQLILMGMYFNIIIAALSCQKQLQGKKLLMAIASLLSAIFH